MEFWKNDERTTRIVKTRPEVSRRGKPCSKIEAKLRSRRQSKLEIEEKRGASRLKRTPKNSSSESEISPRFFTSKQHVELVNFHSPNVVPLFRKCSRDSHKIETKKSDESSSGSRSKNSLECFFNENGSISKRMEDSNILSERKKENALLSRRETSGIKKIDNKEFNKKRSRSAPCTPLFKIKCSKDKFPRDLIVDGKCLVANETREKMGNYGKNVPLSLRISRSGDVSVSSWDGSSKERIIERRRSGEPEARPEDDAKVNELFLFVKKLGKLETNDNNDSRANVATCLVEDSAINECTQGMIEAEEEIINSEKEIIGANNKLIDAGERIIEAERELTSVENGIIETGEKLDETEEDTIEGEEKNKYEEALKEYEEKSYSQENSQVFAKNVSSIENIANTTANEEHRCPEEIAGAEKNTKKMFSRLENLENKEERKSIVDDYFSTRKLPKKREFRWETTLEKHRRTDESIGDAVNAKKSMEIIENVEVDKFKFWAEKTKINSQKIAPPKWRNAFVGKKLEAYRVIKQELPKLFMKRQISDAMRNKRVYEGGKSREQGDKSNGQIWKNKEIIGEPTMTNAKFPKRASKEDFRPKIRNFENLAVNDVAQKNTTKENEGLKNSRPSILKRRKSPSPRRVTFRLPGRFINEKSFEEKIAVTRKIDGKAVEFENSCEPVEQFIEEIGQDEKVRNLRDKQKCGRHDRFNCCAPERTRKDQPNKFINWNATKNLTNSPCIHAIEGQEDSREFEDFEQDWETPTSEDVSYAWENVTFPKETREAMKVLLRAKQTPRRDHYDHCQKRVTDRHSAHWKRSENSRRQNSPTVPSYIEPPGKFQQTREHQCQQKLPTTSRSRSSRNTDAAVGK